MTDTYRIKALCCKKPAPFNCPCCGSAPVVKITPPCKGSWGKLGEMRKLECPMGCFGTRNHWYGKEVKAWNSRAAQIANQMRKAERGQRIKQALEAI